MSEVIKSKSPFFPGQPVPEDSFVGRKIEIDKVVHRGIRRVAAGTTDAFFIEGEYGIGKTSVAQYLKALAEKEHHLHAIYVSLGAAHTLEDVAVAVLEATVQSGAFSATRQGTIRHWLSKYIKEVKLFGVALNIPALHEDAAQVSTISGMLNFLRNVKKQLEGDGVLGVMLILDEINGIAYEPKFAHFLKGLIDQNTVDGDPAPFLLLLCGTRERWHALTRSHEPVERIFRLIEIFSLGEKEVQSFFEQSFSSAGLKVDDEALSIITHFSAGYPRLMHLIGDCAYWSNSDDTIDKNDALLAVMDAADELGKKHIDREVLTAIHSPDYHSMLEKMGGLELSQTVFTRKELFPLYSENEQKKVDKFLRRMRELHVLKKGEGHGEYIFTQGIIQLYLWIKYKSKKMQEDQIIHG